MTATTPVLEENRAKRYNAAKAEHKLLTAWEKAGRKGARPATPNYDALQAAPAAAKSSKAAKASTPKADRPAVKNVTTEQLRPHVKAQLDAGVTSKPDVIKKLRAAGYRWPTGSVKQIMTELGALGTKPAKASAAKKTSPAKATAAKKAPAKKTVTPITKAQQARKSAAKKTTAR